MSVDGDSLFVKLGQYTLVVVSRTASERPALRRTAGDLTRQRTIEREHANESDETQEANAESADNLRSNRKARRCASPNTIAIVRSTIGGAKRTGWRGVFKSVDDNYDKSEVRVATGPGPLFHHSKSAVLYARGNRSGDRHGDEQADIENSYISDDPRHSEDKCWSGEDDHVETCDERVFTVKAFSVR